jgi:hypothetical protein
MVDFKSKIKSQKSKDRERAGKKRKSVSGDRLSAPPKAKLPSARQSSDNSAAILKSAVNLFKGSAKGDDPYSGYEPGDWGGDTDLGDFESASWFGETGNFGGGGSFTSGFEGAGMSGGFKKGGRLKNAGKRKRAALRGQRSELRGS